jgi:DNA polymerase zeta
MCRVTKKFNFLLFSASKYQVWNQSILEYIPFVKEPPKNFFYSPVIVLDFQSLYPSIIIAHNICYSTCLGKLSEIDIDELNEANDEEIYLNDKSEFKR